MKNIKKPEAVFSFKPVCGAWVVKYLRRLPYGHLVDNISSKVFHFPKYCMINPIIDLSSILFLLVNRMVH